MPTSTDYIDRVNCYFMSLRHQNWLRGTLTPRLNLAAGVRSPKIEPRERFRVPVVAATLFEASKNKNKTKQQSQDSTLSYLAFHSSALDSNQ